MEMSVMSIMDIIILMIMETLGMIIMDIVEMELLVRAWTLDNDIVATVIMEMLA